MKAPITDIRNASRQALDALNAENNTNGSAIMTTDNFLPLDKGKADLTSLQLPSNLTPDEWEGIGRKLGQFGNAHQWWIGDWWAFGKHKLGKRAAIVKSKDWTGPSYTACKLYGTISRAFDRVSRITLLSFAHHQTVVAIKNETERQELLDWCAAPLQEGESRPKSVKELRKELQARGLVKPKKHKSITPSDRLDKRNPSKWDEHEEIQTFKELTAILEAYNETEAIINYLHRFSDEGRSTLLPLLKKISHLTDMYLAPFGQGSMEASLKMYYRGQKEKRS